MSVKYLKHAEEIAANLERSEESIKAAKELARGSYFDFNSKMQKRQFRLLKSCCKP